MFLVRLFKFITGYVIFCGTGGFAERFINLCSQHRIPLWNTKAVNGKLTSCTSIIGYKKIRLCAKKSGMRIRIKKKCGLPFILRPYFKRKGIFAGIALSIILGILLTNMLWTFDVTGNEKYTREQILSIVEKQGIYPGAFKNSIDLKKVRTAISAETDFVSNISININGCHTTINVTEAKGSTQILDTVKPCNLVSGIDGEVLKIEAESGVPAVKPGNAVRQGDLLISGVAEKTDGTPYFLHARGSAVIRSNVKQDVTVPLTIDVQKITDIKKQHGVTLFTLNIPLSLPQKSKLIREDTLFLNYNDRQLPIGTLTKTFANFEKATMQLTANQAALFVSFKSFCEECVFMQNAKIETKTVELILNDDNISLKSDIIIHKTTGIEYYFEVE